MPQPATPGVNWFNSTQHEMRMAIASTPWYTIRAKSEDTAEVLIYGNIGESWFGDSVTAQEFVKELQNLADKNLVVRINSYGGSVSDGVAIYNAIKRHPKSKTIEIDGVAVSIASLIAMAGDTVNMAGNAMFMVHAPWGAAVGNSAVMREYADVLDKHAEAMATSYAAKTGKSVEEIYELLSDGDDHWYTAQEAKDANFIDAVTGASTDEESARYRQAALARFKIPAAAAARFAAIAAQLTPKENPMPQPKDPAADPKPDNVTEIEKAAQAKEQARIKARNAEIKTAFAKFMNRDGVSALYDECIADPAVTTGQANAQLLAKLGEGAEPLAPAATGRVTTGEDARDKLHQQIVTALMHRGGRAPKAEIQGNPYRSMTLLDVARDCLARTGINTGGMDKMQLVAAAITQTTSDFPILLESTMHKTLLEAYRVTADTWSRFCKTGSVSDFRAHPRYRVGSLGNLESLNEAGEFRHKAIPDGEKASITADTKGNIITISRKAIINDDLGAFLDLAAMLGRAAKRTIEADVYALLALNGGLGPVLADGLTLFHANHGNIGVGAAISVEAIDADSVLMAQQKDVGGNDYLDLAPWVLLLPKSLGGTARVINDAQYDPDTANKLQRPNKVRGLFRDIVDTARLTGTRRYLLADPGLAPVLEVAFLDGNQEPFLEVQNGWTVDGAEYKGRIDFAVAGTDYRGAVTNAGV